MKQFTENDRLKMLELYEQGWTNREIAKELGFDKSTISNHLTKEGKTSNFYKGTNKKTTKSTAKMQTILNVDENQTTAICSKCGKEKPITEFQYGRVGTPKEYRFSYCNECRKKQVYDNLNSDFNKFFHDKYNRWKRSAISKNCIFNITEEELLEIYNKQNGKCFYSGREMEWGTNKGIKTYGISIDKVIPSKGYIKSNVVLCTTKMNTVKNNLSLSDIKEFMPPLYEKLINCKWLDLKEDITNVNNSENSLSGNELNKILDGDF